EKGGLPSPGWCRSPVSGWLGVPLLTMPFKDKISFLERLPIPRLEDTIRRYLAAQRPLLDDVKFRQTEKISHSFLNGVGRDLHEELVAKDKYEKHTSYIAGPFLEKYLCSRDSLVTANAFIIFTSDRKKEYNNQLVRATNIVCSAARFLKTLRTGLLEPEVFHLSPRKSDSNCFKKFIRWVPSSLSWYGASMMNAYPLDMSQYARLFNTTRIPRLRQDELFTDENGRHVLVMRKGNMYVFDIVDRDGNLVKPAEIHANLKYILDDSTTEPTFPLGFLTTENRDVWANLRNKLIAAGNAEELHIVDSALFCLCLDDETLTDITHITQNVLSGGGCNRWYDKSFSIILTKNGESGVNFEHSWGDGVSVLRFVNEIHKDTTEQPLVHPGSATAAVDPDSVVRRLQFKLDTEMEDAITKARKNSGVLASNLSVHVTDFKRGGRKFFKEKKVSPDAIMQLAFQMGFLRQYGQTVATTESCSTAAFRHGRLEDIWPVTLPTKTCSHAFVCQPGQHSVEHLNAMLSECSKYHKQLINEAATGNWPAQCQGFGCHLYVLRHLAMSKGQTLPCLYTDPSYAKVNHIILSSTTLSSGVLRTGGAAPVVSDGFGLGYGFRDSESRTIVTSYPTLNSHEFQQCVHKSLTDIFNVLEGKPIS
uniref:Carnitine palmitoyltransferase 2 n=1 Tax=Takifugu rubripes TaxID=31033 RepID=H2V092_TAKRU